MPKVIPADKKACIKRCFEEYKKDRPDFSNENIFERLSRIFERNSNFSKTEHRVFSLETVTDASCDKIGTKPVVANQLLCFVIHGLSTKYVIPASYYFHQQLNSKDLYKLTLKVLKLLHECGFEVIRIVGDNHKSHVSLFKQFGNGKLENMVVHPFDPALRLLLSFDYCHLVKNCRNLFLDHDMASRDGVITADYLKELLEVQQNLIIKPVRFLTKKHMYPSNLEKMKIYLAIQIFFPSVTASIQYLADHGGQEYPHFKDSKATVTYMENIFKFFKIHDVSNRVQHIHQRDVNSAPYTSENDVRLHWLKEEFPQYIKDIQSCSAEKRLKGLSKETADALIFTSNSSYLCISYLLKDLNFYYVLTRRFSSDPVESIFAHVRLRGGSNDLTDCRAVEHALRQILRSGLIKNVKSSNSLSTLEYISEARLPTENLQDPISEISNTKREHYLQNLKIYVSIWVLTIRLFK
ncbi:Transposable element P transposase-like Protein [Tribolium castaneum]|uniref:Transposable element P transposase-like Protein n=1 Tax=Tribolium castaneum TaxID=7070 RepID=D7EIH3_TRICA|nr:Transposable element P transposase-like Protein [Tribolium castaneum]